MIMTAAELIEKLSQLHPDTRIVVRGYEDSVNDILKLIPRKIKLNTNVHWYEGAHQQDDSPEAIEVVELFGENLKATD